MPTAIRYIGRIQDCDDYGDALAWAGAQTFNAGLSVASGQGVTMADDSWIGIGAALERIVFDAAGDVSIMGANVGIGTLTPGATLDLYLANAAIHVNKDGFLSAASPAHEYGLKDGNNTVLAGLVGRRARSGGVGGVGLGIAHLFQLENAGGVNHDAGKYEFAWTDPTAGSEDAYFAVNTMEAGSFVEGLRVVGGNVGIGGVTSPRWPLTVDGGIGGLERSSDPLEPTEGTYVIWMSDGSGLGDDGDLMIAARAGGVTNWGTLFDYSAGTPWV